MFYIVLTVNGDQNDYAPNSQQYRVTYIRVLLFIKVYKFNI